MDCGIGHRLYKQMMNGVSHMFPWVVGGGILIALWFLIDGFAVDLNSLAVGERSSFGTITPVAEMFYKIGSVAFEFMLLILAGYIAMAIGDRPACALGFVGGVLAASGKSGFLGAMIAGFLAGYIIRLLGKLCNKLPEARRKTGRAFVYPVVGILAMVLLMHFVTNPIMGAINTAAYTFGTTAIAAGNYDIMAAVMIGSMTSPCAIGLATLIFKNKFTEEERKYGPANFAMGLAFIPQGIIPYVAADPIHVLPACIIGSGLAGALSMLSGCTVMAPHGGVFVWSVVGNVWMYLLALVIGTVVSTVLLGVWKRTII